MSCVKCRAMPRSSQPGVWGRAGPRGAGDAVSPRLWHRDAVQVEHGAAMPPLLWSPAGSRRGAALAVQACFYPRPLSDPG